MVYFLVLLAMAKYCRQSGLKNKNLFLTVLEVRKMSAWLVWVRVLFLTVDNHFPPVFPWWGRERKKLYGSNIRNKENTMQSTAFCFH
jgi:hypothetical protein